MDKPDQGAPEAPRDLIPSEQRRLVIMAYWPRLRRDDLPIGYAMAKGYLWLQLPLLFYNVVHRAFAIWIEPKLRPRGRLLVRNAPLLATGFTVGLISMRMQRIAGYYQLNEQGTPIRFISKRVPPSIHGRRGTTRRGFLHHA
jgi:hypothetical protein